MVQVEEPSADEGEELVEDAKASEKEVGIEEEVTK